MLFYVSIFGELSTSVLLAAILATLHLASRDLSGIRLDAMWQGPHLERATGDPFNVLAPLRACLAVPAHWLLGTNRGAQSSAAVRDCRK